MTISKLLSGGSMLALALRNAEGGSGGAGDPGGEPAPAPNNGADPENVLFPEEKKEGDGNPAAGEGEGDGKKEGEEGDDKKSDDTADKVPEDGKYDLKLPEGIEMDQELAEALGPEFAAAKLTNAQAQKLVDKYIEIQKQRAEKQGSEWAETVNKWAEEAKSDKEIGGANWDATVTNARRAVETLGTPGLKEYLNWTGGGNHPELIRFMSKVGAMIREDNPPAGGVGGKSKPADAAYILFPNDAPKG